MQHRWCHIYCHKMPNELMLEAIVQYWYHTDFTVLIPLFSQWKVRLKGVINHSFSIVKYMFYIYVKYGQSFH